MRAAQGQRRRISGCLHPTSAPRRVSRYASTFDQALYARPATKINRESRAALDGDRLRPSSPDCRPKRSRLGRRFRTQSVEAAPVGGTVQSGASHQPGACILVSGSFSPRIRRASRIARSWRATRMYEGRSRQSFRDGICPAGVHSMCRRSRHYVSDQALHEFSMS